MRVLKNILSQLHVYVVWLILSIALWGFVFGLLTDTGAERKVTVYADVERCRSTEMDVALESAMPAGIKMIRVHPFSYVMFDDASLLNADLYIVKASSAEEYRDSFRALDLTRLDTGDLALLELDGAPCGVRVWDGQSGCAAEYLGYEAEEYYLFVGANSVHAGEPDAAAYAVAEEILKLP